MQMRIVLFLGWLAVLPASARAAADPLDAWRDGAPKSAIMDFVRAISDAQDPRYVPPAARIAVFDNDGTLWAEKPDFFPVLLAEDLVRAHAADHPTWQNTEPFRSILSKTPRALSWADMRDITLGTFAGTSPWMFRDTVNQWLQESRHPRFNRAYDSLTYVPMRQLLALLETYGFTTYLCTGAETEFVRAFSQELYNVPPERIIGSDLELAYRYTDHAEIERLPAFREPFNERAGKAVNFARVVARKPLIAVGNSNGDIEMLTLAEGGLAILVNHDDAGREYAYTGGAEEAQSIAKQHGWTVVSMLHDFARMFD